MGLGAGAIGVENAFSFGIFAVLSNCLNDLNASSAMPGPALAASSEAARIREDGRKKISYECPTDSTAMIGVLIGWYYNPTAKANSRLAIS